LPHHREALSRPNPGSKSALAQRARNSETQPSKHNTLSSAHSTTNWAANLGALRKTPHQTARVLPMCLGAGSASATELSLCTTPRFFTSWTTKKTVAKTPDEEASSSKHRCERALEKETKMPKGIWAVRLLPATHATLSCERREAGGRLSGLRSWLRSRPSHRTAETLHRAQGSSSPNLPYSSWNPDEALKREPPGSKHRWTNNTKRR